MQRKREDPIPSDRLEANEAGEKKCGNAEIKNEVDLKRHK